MVSATGRSVWPALSHQMTDADGFYLDNKERVTVSVHVGIRVCAHTHTDTQLESLGTPGLH